MMKIGMLVLCLIPLLLNAAGEKMTVATYIGWYVPYHSGTGVVSPRDFSIVPLKMTPKKDGDIPELVIAAHRAELELLQQHGWNTIGVDGLFYHHAALVKNIPAPQRAHGAYRSDAPRKTVLRAAVLPPESVVRILEIGQPYIHRVPRRADDGGIVATVAVPHNGQFTSRFELFKHGNEPFRPRSRGDEVDILGALFF